MRTWATFQPAVTGKATAAASDVEQREPTSWARGRALATIEVSMAYDNSDGRLRGRKLQAARLRIWSADPHCARCRKLVAYPHGFELDHIKALHKDGSTNDDDNMQVLCPPCHVKKSAVDMGYKERSEFSDDGRVIW